MKEINHATQNTTQKFLGDKFTVTFGVTRVTSKSENLYNLYRKYVGNQ